MKDERRKSNDRLYLVMIITLLALVVVLGGTVIYMRYNLNEKSSTTEETTTTENQNNQTNNVKKRLDDNDERVLKLKKMIGVTDIYSKSVGRIDLNNYFAKNKTVNLSQTTPSFRNSLIFLMYQKELENYENDDINTAYINESNLKKYYGEWFDINTYQTANINWFDNLTTEYDTTNQRYYYHTGVGDLAGMGGWLPHSIYAYAEENQDVINLYAYYYISTSILENDSYNSTYYSDYNHTNLIISNNQDAHDKSDETKMISEFKDKLGLHRYVFEKEESGKYVFSKFETLK